MIADVRTCCVPTPTRRDETPETACISRLRRSPDRRRRGSERLPVRAPSGCCRWGLWCGLSNHPVGFRRTLRGARGRDRLTSPTPPEGDMGDICRKFSFDSSVLPKAPKCNASCSPPPWLGPLPGGCVFPTEWPPLRYLPVRVIRGHLSKDYWAVDLGVSW
jgi:hypothetical protein